MANLSLVETFIFTVVCGFFCLIYIFVEMCRSLFYLIYFFAIPKFCCMVSKLKNNNFKNVVLGICDMFMISESLVNKSLANGNVVNDLKRINDFFSYAVLAGLMFSGYIAVNALTIKVFTALAFINLVPVFLVFVTTGYVCDAIWILTTKLIKKEAARRGYDS